MIILGRAMSARLRARTSGRLPTGSRRLALLGALGLTLAACASPVSAVRVDPTVAHRDLAPERRHHRRAELGDARRAPRGRASSRRSTSGRRRRSPLHRAMVATGGRSRTCSSRSPSYPSSTGRRRANPEYRLAAAVYAYAFLFPEGDGARARAVRSAPADRRGPVQLVADGAVRVEGRLGGRPARRHVRRCRSDRSTSPSIPPPCARETASCIGSSRSPSWRWTVWRCAIAGRASARPLAASTPADRRREARPATWWRRGCRCR